MNIEAKFKVGDKVTVNSLLPNVYTIVAVDMNQMHPYLPNTASGFWYHEDSLKLVEAQSNHPEAAASETLQAPFPKFAVGDKVRYINAKYADDEYDTVISVGRDLSGYRYIVRYADNEESTIDFAERALEAYEEQSALVEIPDTLAENRKREELLEARIAKLEADLHAAGNIIIEAGKQVEKSRQEIMAFAIENDDLKSQMVNLASEAIVLEQQVETLKKDNEALSSAISESPIVEALSKQVQDLQVHLSFILGYTESAANSLSNPKRDNFREIAKRCEVALGKQSASTESPKRAASKRMRVNWSGRGFSSGDYEVLGHSQEKQAYVLNISTDAEKPMPKWVKFADCQ